MTVLESTGDGFTLYPLPHWQEVAQIIRKNVAALRERRDQLVAEAQDQKAKDDIKEYYGKTEHEMMKGYKKMVDMHLEFVERKPQFRTYKWTKSDPLGSPHKDNIHPALLAKAQGRRYAVRSRRDQIYNGRRIRFHADS